MAVRIGDGSASFLFTPLPPGDLIRFPSVFSRSIQIFLSHRIPRSLFPGGSSVGFSCLLPLCSAGSSALPLPVHSLNLVIPERFVERWFIPPRGRKSSVAEPGRSPWQGLCWLRAAQSLGIAICSPSVHLAVLWGGSCNPNTLSLLMAVTAVCVIHHCVPKAGMSPPCCGHHLVSRVMAWLCYVSPAALGAGRGVMLGV